MTFSYKAKRVLQIAFPAALNNFLDVIQSLVGLFMLGQLSSNHIIAVGVSFNFIMFLYCINAIFYMGTNSQISRLYPLRKFKEMHKIFSSMFWGVGLVSIPVVILALILNEVYFEWINVGTEAKALGMQFCIIVSFGIPATLMRNVIVASMSACSNALIPLLIKIIISSIAVFLHYCLIFGFWIFPEMGITGMAISLLATSFLELFLLFFLAKRLDKDLLFIQIKPLEVSPSIVLKGFRVGFPVGLERLLTIISITLVTKIIAGYGPLVLAGFQIGVRVESFSYLPGFGLMVASMSLVGQSLGDNTGESKFSISEALVINTIVLGSIFMGSMGFIMAIFRIEIATFFASEALVIKYASLYLGFIGLIQIPYVFILVLDGAHRGAQAGQVSLYINMISIWFFKIIPMSLCPYFNISVYGIYIIIFAEVILRASLFFIAFKLFFKRLAKV